MNSGSQNSDDDRDRIEAQASEWVVLHDERELTDAEQDELDRWLAADPRHATAWHALRATCPRCRY